MTTPSRRVLWRVVQIALAAIVLALVLRKLAQEWGAVKLALDAASPNWLALVASGVIVLATYAILIETWRVMLLGWQHDLPFIDAARIWTVSTLGRSRPGTVGSIPRPHLLARGHGEAEHVVAFEHRTPRGDDRQRERHR